MVRLWSLEVKINLILTNKLRLRKNLEFEFTCVRLILLRPVGLPFKTGVDGAGVNPRGALNFVRPARRASHYFFLLLHNSSRHISPSFVILSFALWLDLVHNMIIHNLFYLFIYLILDFKRKIQTCIGVEVSELQISSLAL